MIRNSVLGLVTITSKYSITKVDQVAKQINSKIVLYYRIDTQTELKKIAFNRSERELLVVFKIMKMSMLRFTYYPVHTTSLSFEQE